MNTLQPGCRHQRRSRQAGVTLIELLVAVLLGSALIVAITTMLMKSEAGRRNLTATNDSSQNAAFVSFALDQTLRSAGSGFSQAWRQAFGCRVLAARNGTQTLPRGSAFPAPFDAVPQTVRLAPLIVHAGIGTDGSDILAVATGASGLGEAPLRIQPGSVTGTMLRLPSTLGLKGNDLVLVLEDASNCMVQQVASPFTGGVSQDLNFGGTYASSVINAVNLDSMGATGASAQAFAVPLGNIAGRTPALQLLGIGPDATLVSLDMLNLNGTDSVTPIADSVVDLRARYGVDSNDDGVVDTWVDPASPDFSAATLLNGSAESQLNLSRIQVVRVGLIMRNALRERNNNTSNSLKLFADMDPSLQVTRNLTANQRKMRHRTVELTVPLRNVMMMPRT